jgi:arginyl-tRNA synthetase
MSKRGGNFVSTDEVLDEVGADATRFMLITSSANAAMDFDLQLAVEQSNENPVYYVQYAHARIAGILRNAAAQGITVTEGNPELLRHPSEMALIKQMLKLEEVVEFAATKLEPHHLTHYALELARAFSGFYDDCPILPPKQTDAALMQARLKLVRSAKLVLARTLDLMGVTAPESM